MKLSTRCRYGVRAMLDIAKNGNAGPVKRKDISRNQGVTKGYLENILSLLRAQHLVATVRGAGGGFVLTRKPHQITLLEIVTALEGTLAPVECVENPHLCQRSSRCGAHNVWKKVHRAQTGVLSSLTLADMVAMETGGPVADYSI